MVHNFIGFLFDEAETVVEETTAAVAEDTTVFSFFTSLWAKIADYAATMGVRIVAAILILIIGLWLTKRITKLIAKGKKFQTFPPATQKLISGIVKVLLVALVVIIVASILGVPMTSFVALLTTGSLAIGMAVQGSLSNLAGGIMLIIFKPFVIGDFINDGNAMGTVEDIGIFYTKVVTVDNKRITIPNGALANSTITNFSVKDTRRVDFEFTVAYDSDIDKTKQVIMDCLTAHELTLDEPAPMVRLTRHGDSALVFVARVWVKSADYWTVNFDLMEEVKKKLDENGIQIPYPQVDVHVKEK